MKNSGFTLVEILVVTVVMSLIVMAIYSLHQSTQRSAYTSEEIVDVQQSLRFSMDQMARDIRMAGFLVTGDPVDSAPASLCFDLNGDGDCLDTDETPSFVLNASAANGQVARINEDFASPANAASTIEIEVAYAEMVDFFEGGDDAHGDYVRIIRPATGVQPLDRVFRVTAKDRTVPSITLREFNASNQFRRGDLITRVGSSVSDTDHNPNTDPPLSATTIAYSLVDDAGSDDPEMKTLRRTFNGSTEIVANKITDVNFVYLDEDGNTMTALVGREDEIRAIQIEIAGATDATRTGRKTYSGIKDRRLLSVVKLRNF